jgi:hypothetical protein
VLGHRYNAERWHELPWRANDRVSDHEEIHFGEAREDARERAAWRTQSVAAAAFSIAHTVGGCGRATLLPDDVKHG